MNSIDGVVIYGDNKKIDDSLGIVVFNIGTMYNQTVAEILSKEYGISVRQGWFCAHPYCRRLMHLSEKVASEFIKDKSKKMPGMIRVSLGMYNDEREVDYFLKATREISKRNK